jgi:predicted ATPase
MAGSGRWAAEAERVARELVSLTREQRFPLLLGYGLLLQGTAMALRGQGEAAADRFHEGATAMQTTGVNRSEPTALCYLAEALALNGAVAEGLRVVAAALAEAQASGTHWGDAELHRLRGDLLGRLPSTDCIEVETRPLLLEADVASLPFCSAGGMPTRRVDTKPLKPLDDGFAT